MQPRTADMPANAKPGFRANHLDWLRALIVFMLIFYHTVWIFIGKDWLITNPISNSAAIVFYQILDLFQMPLLFTIAGVATWFSLGNRTGKEYLIERTKRLFVPLIFGMLILNAIAYYISVLFQNQAKLYNNSYFTWYQIYLKTKLFPWQQNWSPGIMWFLWYLLIYSIILFPLFIFIHKNFHNNIQARLNKFIKKYKIITMFVLAILPVLVQIYPPPNFYSNAQITYYLFFFIYGFFMYSTEELSNLIYKLGSLSLVTGIITSILVILLISPNPTHALLGSFYWPALGNKPDSLGQTLYLILRGISCWFLILGLIFLAKKWGEFSNRFLQYANEIVLPFYLIHFSFVIALGYYIIPLDITILSKFVIIAVFSLVLTLGTIELFKKSIYTRFLVGMRFKQNNHLKKP
jgi:glucans biosynthesis protein C